MMLQAMMLPSVRYLYYEQEQQRVRADVARRRCDRPSARAARLFHALTAICRERDIINMTRHA